MNRVKYVPGEIVLIPWPYTDYSQDKFRPALVISCSEFNSYSPDVVLLAISSVIRQDYKYGVLLDRTIPEFAQTGLHKPSMVMCGKMFTYDKRSIRRRIGAVSPRLLKQISETLNQVLVLK